MASVLPKHSGTSAFRSVSAVL
ncbi:hypothetical protein INT48_009340, partial [Thamnidium elegans]